MIKTEQLKSIDLEAINRLTLEPLTEAEVFTFGARLIDDAPTGNGRVWSQEWQDANLTKFIGAPVTVNHNTSDASLVMGRVYAAERRENATYGSIFIPLTSKTGQEAAEKVRNGQLKSLSINARAEKSRKENDLDVILPSDSDRILEVSFVAVGGCQACGVLKESCECETKIESQNESEKALKEKFLLESLAAIQNQFIRSVRFVLGPQAKRELYAKVAESLAPYTLKEICQDLETAYQEQNRVRQSSATSESRDLAQEIEHLRNLRGI